MANKRFVSSRREKRVPASELFTTSITERERRELRRLARLAGAKVDFSDAPEVEPASQVVVGRFYRTIKPLGSILG
jgi:hypothetical protein